MQGICSAAFTLRTCMRLSIAYDEEGSVPAAPSGDPDGQKLVPANEEGTAPAAPLSDPDGQKPVPATAAEILISPAPGPGVRHFLTVLALVLLAIVVLRLWLPDVSPETETGPIAPTAAAVPPWAPAEPQQAARPSGQACTSRNATTVDRPTAYVQFCQNSGSLCDGAVGTVLVDKQRWGQ